MKILGIAKTDHEIHLVEAQLQQTGLYSRYEGHVSGEEGTLVIVCVHNTEEKEQVKDLMENAGVTDITYQEDQLAANY